MQLRFFADKNNTKRKQEYQQHMQECQQRMERFQKNTCAAVCDHWKIAECAIVDDSLKIVCIMPEVEYVKTVEIKQ